MSVRTRAQRRDDVLRRFTTDADVWIATSGERGGPHLVPLSLAWAGGCLLVATPTDTATVRNAAASGTVRAALDSTADVVIVDAVADVVDFGAADPSTVGAYVDRVGWDPRDEPGTWSLLVLRPTRVLAWRGVAEIEGRTIMRDGAWLD